MMRVISSLVTAALILVMTSSAFAAERPEAPASFAPVADSVKAAVFSVVLPTEDAVDGSGDAAASARDLLQQLVEALGGAPNRTLGAAVMLKSSGIAVTGARILRGLTELEVVAVDGRRYSATVLGLDDRSDIAVLQVVGPAPFPTARLGNSDETGVIVLSVRPGSPAAKVGLRRGDLVRELDHRVIRNLADFDEAAAAVDPAQSITLLVQRSRVPSYVVLVPDR